MTIKVEYEDGTVEVFQTLESAIAALNAESIERDMVLNSEECI